MPFPTTAALMAAGNIAGSGITAAASSAEGHRTRRFQRWMAEHAHQLEVADLRAAGLNPILSAGGSGASAPSAGIVSMPDLGRAVESGIASALQLKSIKRDNELKSMEIKARAVELEERKRQLAQKRRYGEMWYDAELVKNSGLVGSLIGALSNSAASLFRVPDLRKSRTGYDLREPMTEDEFNRTYYYDKRSNTWKKR